MRRFFVGTIAVAVLALAMTVMAAGSGGSGAGVALPAARTAAGVPAASIGHVWIFVFENTSYADVTAASMPYFTQQARAGVTLSQMYAVGHASLDNYIAMTSGYQPNGTTQADCFQYNCVYDRGADDNIANQLEAAGLTWKGYMDSAPKACPKPPAENAPDPYTKGYATRHDPFMYYRSIVGDAARCAAHVVPLTQMTADLAAGSVPSYSFVTPDTCHDAHDGGEAGCHLSDADAWLAQHLPPILHSAAYQRDGAVFLTFDESAGDNTGCCGAKGGGRIATAILSPQLAHPGTVVATPYSHYSLLRTVEDAFGLTCLRHACDASTSSMIGLFKAAPTATTTTAAAGVSSSTASPASTAAGTAAGKSGKSTSSHTGLVLAIVGIGALAAVGALIATKRAARSISED